MTQPVCSAPKSPRRYLIAALVALFVGSVAALGILKWAFNPKPGTPELEIFKAVLQLGVISVAAAAVALLSFDYQFQRQREEAAGERRRQDEEKRRDRDHQEALRQAELARKSLEYREEFLRTILRRATSSYAAVKKARRVLRARALRQEANGKIVLTSAYDEQVDVINDAQLDFENLQGDVDNTRPALSRPDEIIAQLHAVDEYLGELIKEYETERPGFTVEGSAKQLAEFRWLQDFLDHKGNLFTGKVVHPFHDVQRLLRADLLNPQLIDFTPAVARRKK